MRDEDWNELGQQWRSATPDAGVDLAARVRRNLRARRLNLYSEILGTTFALGVIVLALVRAPAAAAGVVPWLAGAAVILVAWQAIHLALRWRFGLFAEPGAGLAGWIDAEQRRVLYLLVHTWSGIPGGVLLLVWAYRTTTFFQAPGAVTVLGAVAGVMLAWFVLRTRSLLRLRRQLEEQRTALRG